VEGVQKQFQSLGVDPERLLFEGQTDRVNYFKAYNKVDIALDPFPYPGGTTSVEGLWMGVPVIARKGQRFIAHNGETIAHNSGQSHWIAEDDDDYVRKAIQFSSDLPALALTRARLRDQLLTSALCDARRFARHFEQAMLEMWRDFQSQA
jgi:predicted O-linked N-acetylglucosamine transferase (SPINDLY family)